MFTAFGGNLDARRPIIKNNAPKSAGEIKMRRRNIFMLSGNIFWNFS
jgi:hypothetical protein